MSCWHRSVVPACPTGRCTDERRRPRIPMKAYVLGTACNLLACTSDVAAHADHSGPSRAATLLLAAPPTSSGGPDAAPSISALPALGSDGQPVKPSDHSRCNATRPSAPRRTSDFAHARALSSQDELATLQARARGGAPERVTVLAKGTFTMLCECAPFAVFYADGASELVMAVPSQGVPDILTQRTALQFILQGYFSGATINTYEHFSAVDKDPGTPDEEQRTTWLDTYPEFCLESWCFTIPDWSSEEWADVRAFAAEHAKGLLALGVPQCPKQRDPRRE